MTYNRETYLAKQKAEAIARNKPIKAYANHSGWSDVRPYEVIEVRTENKVVIRKMNVERKEGWKPEFVSGGFAGHCINNENQHSAWDITSDKNGREVTIRFSKAKCQWQDKHGNRYFMSDEPVYHYDFNF